MQTVIVLISVSDSSEGRKVAENIENEVFRNPETLLHKIKEKDCGWAAVFSLSDFMDACNNEEIDLNGVWISYAQVDEMLNKPYFS